ncbi:MAG: hypothetical protein ACOC2C_04890 [Cyclonatronaceae bacterium]
MVALIMPSARDPIIPYESIRNIYDDDILPCVSTGIREFPLNEGSV